jgi:hypothetical protein
MHDLSWILLGDFNIIRDVNDTTSTNPSLHFMFDFNQLITDLQLQDLPLNGRTYIWSNKRPQPFFFKLDCVFLSHHWDNLALHHTYLFDLPTTTLDHMPLGLKFKKIDITMTRSFRFETHWLMSMKANDIVHTTCHSITVIANIADDLLKKIAKVRRKMTSWANKR